MHPAIYCIAGVCYLVREQRKARRNPVRMITIGCGPGDTPPTGGCFPQEAQLPPGFAAAGVTGVEAPAAPFMRAAGPTGATFARDSHMCPEGTIWERDVGKGYGGSCKPVISSTGTSTAAEPIHIFTHFPPPIPPSSARPAGRSLVDRFLGRGRRSNGNPVGSFGSPFRFEEFKRCPKSWTRVGWNPYNGLVVCRAPTRAGKQKTQWFDECPAGWQTVAQDPYSEQWLCRMPSRAGPPRRRRAPRRARPTPTRAG